MYRLIAICGWFLGFVSLCMAGVYLDKTLHGTNADPVLMGVMPLLGARNAEFMNNEVPGITVPDRIRERLRGKEGAEGMAEGLKIAREIAAEVLSHFRGIYLVTPLVRYETTAALSSTIRSGEL